MLKPKLRKRIIQGLSLFLVLAGATLLWQVFVPRDFLVQGSEVQYNVKKGMGESEIAKELEDKGIIANNIFFKAYVYITGNHTKLQAGLYNVSPSMSIYEIVKKLIKGDVIKSKVTLLEGWDVTDMAAYLQKKNIYAKSDFDAALAKDYSAKYDFLKKLPKGATLEGFIFPDTYLIPTTATPDEFVRMTLNNLNNRLTPTLRQKIVDDKRTIFQIITMASIIEKEVKTLEDKKIVSGILWKRLKNGVPLQVDSTVNYVTNKNVARVAIKDTKIDSPYNTYKYAGLPAGPISNPGMDSIMAAIYPTETPYWFFLSAKGSGKTIFSKTMEEHSASIRKYLN